MASGSNTVSVGSVGAERRITNVAPGINGTDAVNMNQLGTVSSGLSDRITRLDHTMSYGIAGATALAEIPALQPEKKFTLGVGIGSFNGYQSLAIGGGLRVNQGLQLKAGASISGGSSTFGAGMAYSW